MKNYQKPIILLNSELSEGVYTASGDSLNWEFGELYNHVYVLTLHIPDGQTVSSPSVTVSLTGTYDSLSFASGTAVIKDNLNGTATITFNGTYNGKDIGEEGIGCIITAIGASDDFSITVNQ